MQTLILFDVRVVSALNNFVLQSNFAKELTIFFAEYLAFVIPVVFLITLFQSHHILRTKIRTAVLVFVSAIVASFTTADILRAVFMRARPFAAAHALLPENTYSFPSGHASFFFAFAMAVYLFDKRWGAGAFAGATIMGLARVAAGVHYPTDIIAGAVVGVTAAYLVSRVSLMMKR